MQETPPKPRRKRRLLRWTLVTALLTLVALVAGRRFTLDPLLARALEMALVRGLGGTATIQSVTGSYLGAVEIAGLSFSAPRSEDLRQLTARRLRVEYSLWDAWHQQPWLHRVEADGLDVDVFVNDEPTEWSALPADLPEVMLTDSRFHFFGSGYSITVENARGTVALEPATGSAVPAYAMEASVGAARVEVGDLVRAGSLSGSCVYRDAEVSEGRVTHEGRALLDAVHGDLRRLAESTATVGGELLLPGGRVLFDSTLAADDASVTLHATGLDVAATLAEAGFLVPSLRGSLGLDATVTVPWSAPRLAEARGSVTLRNPGWQEWTLERLAMEARYAEAALEVTELTAARPGAELRVSPLSLRLPAELADWRGIRVDGAAQLDVADLTALSVPDSGFSGALQATLQGRGTLGMPEVHLDLTSPGFAVPGAPAAPLHVQLDAGPYEEARLAVPTAQVALGDSQLDLEDVLLRIPAGGDSWIPAVERASVSGSLALEPLGIPEGRISVQASAAGDAAGFAVQLDQLRLSAGETLTLARPTRIEFRPPRGFTVASLELEAPTGKVTAAASGDASGLLDVTVEASGVALEPWRRWLPETLRCNRIEELQAHAQGTLAQLTGELSGDVRGLQVAGSPVLDVQTRMHAEGGTLTLEELHVATAGGSLDATGSGPFPWPWNAALAARPLELQATLEHEDPLRFLPGLRRWVTTGTVQGSLEASGSWSALQWSSTWEVPEVVPARPDLSTEAGTLRAAFSGNPDAVVLDSAEISSPRGSVTARAALATTLTQLLVDPGAALDAPLRATASAKMQDLSWLAAPTGLRRVAGALEGEVTVAGTLRSRQLSGRLGLKDGECRLAQVNAAPWSALNAEFLLQGTTLTIGSFSGELGYSPFQLTGEITGLDTAVPVFDLALSGDELLLYRSRGLKVRANADVTAHGPLSKFAVGGKLELTDSRFTRNFDLFGFTHKSAESPDASGLSLFSLTTAPWNAMTFDVKVLSTQPFEVSNNVLRGALRPQLTLKGTGELPYLLGTVFVDPSTVALPSATLKVSAGTIQFESVNPFEPTLNIVSTTRLLGYDVTAFASGTLTDPAVQLSSSPPLSEEAILLLVMTGQPPDQEVDRTTGQRTLTNVAAYLGKDFVRKAFGNESTGSVESILDRFELQAGKEISSQGTESIEARLRVLDEVMRPDNPLYLEGERSVYDEFNLGLRLVFRFD